MLESTLAGSLPKPDWLAEPEKLWATWRFEGEALARAKERAAAEWLAHQETAGLDIVTDGEMFRTHFVHGFLEHIQGIDWEKREVVYARPEVPGFDALGWKESRAESMPFGRLKVRRSITTTSARRAARRIPIQHRSERSWVRCSVDQPAVFQ